MADVKTLDATVVTMPDMRVIALPHRGDYKKIGEKFGQLFGWAGPAGVPIRGVLGVFHDDPQTTPEEDLRSDACAIVPEDYELTDTSGMDLRIDTVPGGRYAKVTHMGPYEGLGAAWESFMGEKFPTLGVEFGSGPSYEIYVNDCATVAPEEVQTDLYISVK